MNDQLNRLQGYLESKQWDKAWDEFQQLQGEGPPSARLVLMGSHAAFGRHDFFRARHLADESLAIRSASDPPALLGKIRFHLGMVARKIGDSHVSLEQFGLFLSELPSKYPELSMGEGKAYFYQALTLRERRDLAGAVGAYQNAITCCERDGLPSLRCMCLQNLAWLYCHLQDGQNARRYLTESSTLIVTNEDHVHQSLGEAFLALLEKHYGIAAELCESIFRRRERGESVALEEQSQAAWLAGSIALEHDNLETANALAEVSLSFATEAKDSRLMNDANALRRTIYVRRQAGA